MSRQKIHEKKGGGITLYLILFTQNLANKKKIVILKTLLVVFLLSNDHVNEYIKTNLCSNAMMYVDSKYRRS